jgi:hypothetical protein
MKMIVLKYLKNIMKTFAMNPSKYITLFFLYSINCFLFKRSSCDSDSESEPEFDVEIKKPKVKVLHLGSKHKTKV